jgi:hypothetical protein
MLHPALLDFGEPWNYVSALYTAMSRLSASGRPSASSRARGRYRPRVEPLEPRLPPGTVLGLILPVVDLEGPILPDVPTVLDRTELGIADGLSTDLLASGRPVHDCTAAPSLGLLGETDDAPQTHDALLDVNGLGAEPLADRQGVQWLPSRAPALSPPAEFAAVISSSPAVSNALDFAPRPLSGSPSLAMPAMDAQPPAPAAPSQANRSHDLKNYNELPLSFEANQGQTDPHVDFITRAAGATVFLTPTAAVFSIAQPPSVAASARRDVAGVEGKTPVRSSEQVGVALYMDIVGANPAVPAAGLNPLPGSVNYLLGNDPAQWHTHIGTYGRVAYRDTYPGIDLVYYGNQQQLEYDFIVSPGSDPSRIALRFAGSEGMEVNAQGDLVLHTAIGDVVQHKPLAYQTCAGGRQEVASRYELDGAEVRFVVGTYDPTRPLVLDPLVLGYSTFLGGSKGDGGYGIAVDGGGNAYLTGFTTSTDFPTTPGAFDTTYHGGTGEAFVSKLTADGSALAYSTFLGGSKEDGAYGIAVDGGGNAYMTGYTKSTDFPTTPGAFDTTHNGGNDVFVTKLTADGSTLAYSTFLGRYATFAGFGIAVDGSGNAYVTGGFSNAFVVKLNAAGSALDYSLFLGGSRSDYGFAIAVDGGGSAYITGSTSSPDFPTTPGAFDTNYNGGYDAFVTKLTPDGSALAYSTYLGGSGEDDGIGIAVDGAGNAYVTGETMSNDFPTTPGAFQTTLNGDFNAFVTKLTADGSALAYSTFLGGSNFDGGDNIGVDGGGNAYVTGYTRSNDFPTTPDAFQTTRNGDYNAFVTKLTADGSALAYSTFLGGSRRDSGRGIAVDGAGNAYLVGTTSSSDFPTTPGAFSTTYNGGTGEAFVTKFCELS